MSRFNQAPSYEPIIVDDIERPATKQRLEGKMAAIAALGGIGYRFERSTANLPPTTAESYAYPEPIDSDPKASTEIPESTK